MIKIQPGDSIIWQATETSLGKRMLFANKPRLPQNCNFVIVNQYGDWSGFKTLAEAESMIPALNKMMREYPNREYGIVER